MFDESRMMIASMKISKNIMFPLNLNILQLKCFKKKNQ